MINKKSKRAFTLVEVLVAVVILAIALGAMGIIFRMSLDAYRASTATAEIMQKLRAITEQLNADFKGLRKDGIIFLVATVDNPDPTLCKRDDRIVFFTSGDFQSYDDQQTKTSGIKKTVRGNVARISYMLARDSSRRTTRVLARSQHIETADPLFTDSSVAFPNFGAISALSAGSYDSLDYRNKNNSYEYDTDGLWGWWNARQETDPVSPPPYGLYAMLSTCTDIEISGNGVEGGLRVDVDKPESVHLILAEGVGNFTIQGWCSAESRWYPAVDPDGDGDIDTDSDFDVAGGVINYTAAIGTMWKPDWWFVTYSPTLGLLTKPQIEASFSGGIPGIGKMLKFTFTLYDSRGFFPEGRTFTHIVYLDE